MPGTIQISVLEAVDLPVAFSDGTSGKDVTARVTLGTRQFKTESRVADEGRIDSWNSNFAFLVTNLRDKLVVAICDNEDQCLTQTSIEVRSIIEKGNRDEFVELKGGGRIHLSISFVLTAEERKKIAAMRLAEFKRREELVKRTIVFQNVQPISENEFKSAPVSPVTITEVDDSSKVMFKDSQEPANGPLEFGSTTKPVTPMLKFDYARAVGLQPRQSCKRVEKRTNSEGECQEGNVSNDVKATMDDIKYDEQTVSQSESGKKELEEVGSSENVMVDSSIVLSRSSSHRAASSLTKSTDIATSLYVPPSMQDPSSGNVTSSPEKMPVDLPESTKLPKVTSKRRSYRGSRLREYLRNTISNVKACLCMASQGMH